MLSAVRRYKSMLSSALARCFPRTTAYLQAEREALAVVEAQQRILLDAACPVLAVKADSAD